MKTQTFKFIPHLWQLLRLKSVSKAAKELEISQPAMSRVLTQLRRDFGDQLLVRSGSNYCLTPRAEELKKKLSVHMPELINLRRAASFLPKECSEEFHFSGTDLDYYLASNAFTNIRKLAPEIKIIMHSHAMDGFEGVNGLINGNIDLVFMPHDIDRPGLFRKKWFKSEFVCMVSDRCKLRRKDMTLETYLSLQHGSILISKNIDSLTDKAIGEKSSLRKLVLQVPSFSLMPVLSSEPNLIFTVPLHFANKLKDVYPIKILPFPVSAKPIDFYLYWHERQQNNPSHRWMRDTILEDAKHWA
ncbi:LysR family transcriptional regulator [Microbulbifer variabilis]|uniref:LysR family transcriptional regulator n=1 Tax=Microbulbifer variabilis TaxID=266805 RepID=UPI001CFE2431|nr:LysR family transcriptional regulator [Microbulbifer variabilis]